MKLTISFEGDALRVHGDGVFLTLPCHEVQLTAYGNTHHLSPAGPLPRLVQIPSVTGDLMFFHPGSEGAGTGDYLSYLLSATFSQEPYSAETLFKRLQQETAARTTLQDVRNVLRADPRFKQIRKGYFHFSRRGWNGLVQAHDLARARART